MCIRDSLSGIALFNWMRRILFSLTSTTCSPSFESVPIMAKPISKRIKFTIITPTMVARVYFRKLFIKIYFSDIYLNINLFVF